MMVVQIEKPANMTLAVWFTELRSWFDENNCQPTSFFPSGRVIDKLLFDVTFTQNTQARLFASKFGRYAPAIRQATASERCEILLEENSGGTPVIGLERGTPTPLQKVEVSQERKT
jgi:hypothetical protein